MLSTLTKGKWLNLTGSEYLTIDFLTIITAYLFLTYRKMVGGSFAFFQGLVIDIFSGGLHGLYTSLYLIVFGSIYLGSRFFDLQQPQGQLILTALAVLLKQSLFLIGLALFSSGISYPNSFIWISVISAALTGVAAPVLFYIFKNMQAYPLHEAQTALKGKREGFTYDIPLQHDNFNQSS